MIESAVPEGILVATADRQVADVVIDLLRGEGYQVDRATDGATLIQAVRRRPYAVIVLDLDLPEAAGLDGVLRIRRVPHPHGDVPVLALSPAPPAQDAMRCRDAGVDALITVPIDRHGFVETVAHWVDEVADPQWGLEPRPGVPLAVMSRRALDQLADDVGMDLLPEILDTFLTEARRRVALLETATRAGDVQAVREDAHALKGSAGTFGAMALRQAAYAMEQAARDAQADRLPLLMPDVLRLLDETLAALRDATDP